MRSSQRYPLLSLAALLLAFSVLSTSALGRSQALRPQLRVLFIGNSYTYYNNLGDIVAGIASAANGGPTIVPVLATRGGASLQWHLVNGPTMKQLQTGHWDYVVLQEQSLLGGSDVGGKVVVGNPAEFFKAAREWVLKIRGVKSTPILYMTWARRTAAAEVARVQNEIADAYRAIGRELGVKVAPVGLGWVEARRRLRTVDLHIWDNSHPTAAGSYLAGLILYSTLTGQSPVGAPATVFGHPANEDPDGIAVVDTKLKVPLVDLREATANELQEAAWHTVQAASAAATPSDR